jgi:hypothetical protein
MRTPTKRTVREEAEDWLAAITLDRYGHLMPGTAMEAAERLDAYLAAEAARAAEAERSVVQMWCRRLRRPRIRITKPETPPKPPVKGTVWGRLSAGAGESA